MEIDLETIVLETNNPGKAAKKVRWQEDDPLDEESNEDGFNLNWGDFIIEQVPRNDYFMARFRSINDYINILLEGPMTINGQLQTLISQPPSPICKRLWLG
ncbi:hypothetical protein Golob_020534 [Gossypium lobatum]|uniref:Uncharacterized protein n=1 Tax=Gossypium lobatum TaxID=34289 RepID=A0A7J8LAM7_9ROSI|nr:hypothetical protein [Gossypium lobatum]